MLSFYHTFIYVSSFYCVRVVLMVTIVVVFRRDHDLNYYNLTRQIGIMKFVAFIGKTDNNIDTKFINKFRNTSK